MKPSKTTFSRLVKTMDRLRDPGGCPWDRAQTHESLLKYLKEESTEVVEAVKKKDWANLEEELGDILLQVLFHAKLAKERKRFDIDDVIHTLQTKLVLRHPHVFKKGKKEKLSAEDVVNRWDELKKREKEWRRKKANR